MRFRSPATSSILGAALLLCPNPATGQTSAFISSGTAPLYEVPGQDSLTVPLPLGHDRLETGGFFTALEFVLLQQPRTLGYQVVGFRGVIDSDGGITRSQRIAAAIASGVPITDPSLALIQGTPGAILGSGAPALTTHDLGRGTYQPGVNVVLGYKFDGGLVLSMSYMWLAQATYNAGATFVPPGFRTSPDLADTFVTAGVFNFPNQFAGPFPDTGFDGNDPLGNPVDGTYGVWNGADTMEIKYTQRFVLADMTARMPVWDGDHARIYGLAGARFAWFWDQFWWRTQDLSLTGVDLPEFAAIYSQTLSQRMYGPFLGCGHELWLGNSFGLTADVTAAGLINVIKERNKYKLQGNSGDGSAGVPASKRTKTTWEFTPNVNAQLNLWWYPVRGIQMRAGYSAMAFFNTQQATQPIGFNYSAPDPVIDNKFCRFVHGLNVGIGLVF